MFRAANDWLIQILQSISATGLLSSSLSSRGHHHVNKLSLYVKMEANSKTLNMTCYSMCCGQSVIDELCECVFYLLTFSTEVMKTEQPIKVKIMRPVKRCSRMPRNLGCSPGAEHSDSSFRLFTWEMESTVAATNHGRPITEQMPSITPTTNRSRW